MAWCRKSINPWTFIVTLAFISSHSTLTVTNDDFSIDLLQPYSNPNGYIDSKRTHRYVRDCQSVTHNSHGSATFEEFKVKPESHSDIDNLEFRYFTKSISSVAVDDPPHKRRVSGHIAFKTDPLKSFSVLEPRFKGSCSLVKNKATDPRTTTSVSSSQRKCVVAANGGFFNTMTGACIGNIISDGRRVKDAKGIQNANFGVKKDGTIVVGYLDQKSVLSEDNPFLQLISGVGWLLRNGSSYTAQSLEAECADSQETGSLNHFFNVRSARTSIGHDASGRVVIAHVDGKTGQYGVSLEEFALILKGFGVVNAINLDGGGSSTYVINGSVANYPSDDCKNHFNCERKVSTIVCLHGDIGPLDESNTSTVPTFTSGIAFTSSVAPEKMVDGKKDSKSLLSSWPLITALSCVLGISILLNVCLIAQRRSTQRNTWYPSVRDHGKFENEEEKPLAMEEI